MIYINITNKKPLIRLFNNTRDTSNEYISNVGTVALFLSCFGFKGKLNSEKSFLYIQDKKFRVIAGDRICKAITNRLVSKNDVVWNDIWLIIWCLFTFAVIQEL